MSWSKKSGGASGHWRREQCCSLAEARGLLLADLPAPKIETLALAECAGRVWPSR